MTPLEKETRVTELIHQIGIPPKLLGHDYIRSAILMCLEKGDLYRKMCKVLYPAIAKEYGCTVARVDRAIRNAVETAWNRGDFDKQEEIFGDTVDLDKGKPTNSEFIAGMVDYLRMEFKRKEC